MDKFKDKMMRFMQGRYGSDQLARLTMYISFACLIVTIFWHNTFIYFLALVLLIYTYFRMLSRNISRRYNENQIYLKYRYKVIAKFNGFKWQGCVIERHTGYLSVRAAHRKSEFREAKAGLVSSVLSAELNL